MKYLPLALDLNEQDVLVVGAGDVAQRKISWLLKAGAAVTVVAPDASEQLKDNRVVIHNRVYAETDLQQRQLVVVATNNAELNVEIGNRARALGYLVNVVDLPAASNFIFPAIVERGDFTIAISSAGNAPVLTRYWRRTIDALVPAQLQSWADLLGSYRETVKNKLGSIDLRRRFWESVIDSDIAEEAYRGSHNAKQRLDDALDSFALDSTHQQGAVYLIGAGPGDPELMTFKAVRLLQRAEVILYDRLVAPEIVEMGRRDAEYIYVGKRAKDHSLPQQEINALMLKLALEGKVVARLKGGDPFIFGRGAEELEHIIDANIPFEVVPGITAASGCASYAGIPLTHRDHAHSVRFVAGHLKDGYADLAWSSFADSRQTLVFYMGLMGLNTICRELIKVGRDESTPVALVERGTTPNQQVYVGTLTTICEILSKHNVKAPTLIIIGSVVSLHSALAWRGASITN